MEEEVKAPEFILIVKNTEMFKKGGIFRNYDSFWSPVSKEEAFHIKPYDTDYIRPEHGAELLKRGIAVPVLQFDPQFVTAEEDEAIQKALVNLSKKGKK